VPHFEQFPATWPLWWFAQLDAALERNDNRAVAVAVRKLKRLGIEVRFQPPPGCRQEVSGANR
jgi:hypothetical protein